MAFSLQDAIPSEQNNFVLTMEDCTVLERFSLSIDGKILFTFKHSTFFEKPLWLEINVASTRIRIF